MISRYLTQEEHQYAPFIGAAIFYALIVGFPLGLTLAHAAAQGSDLGGRSPQLVQVHGHVQLFGWFGLFVMGMGFRLVSRFTAVKHGQPWLVPATMAAVVAGISLRVVGQTWGDSGTGASLFAVSAVLSLGGAGLFASYVWRALVLGRPDEFGYKPFFGAGAFWLFVALALNAFFVLGAVLDTDPTIPPGRSTIAAFVLLYGFVSMFVFAVSLRTFPVFFGRERADRRLATATWACLNAGVALYTATGLWLTYERSDALRLLQNGGLLLVALGLIGMVAATGVFRGTPHRLRESARRNMRFVRSAYAWLTVAASLQAYFAVLAILDDRAVRALQVDAVRHFLALGFLMTVTLGMAFLVMPALAMRRLGGRPVRIIALVLLALLHGSAAARGAGSLIASEGHLDEGYWTMTAGGVMAILVMAVFLGYLLWRPRSGGDDLPVVQRAE